MAFLGGLLGNMGTATAPGTGLLGKLGTNLQGENPLFNLSMGYLAQLGPSLTPTSPFQRFGAAAQYASQAQQQALQNQLIREKLSESATTKEAQANLEKMIDEAGDTPLVTGIPNALLKGVLRLDPTGASKLLPQAYDPTTTLDVLKLKAQLLDLAQKGAGETAETTTPAHTIGRAAVSLADTFDAVEATPGGNIFAPGNTLYKDSPMGNFGLDAEAALGTPDVILKQFGDPQVIRDQAAQALLIDKETATISRNLQILAQKSGGGKSATAIDQMQTSLGEGNVPIPVRRKVLSSTVDTIIDDLQTKKIEVPEWLTTLQTRLSAKTADVGRNTKGARAGTLGYDPQRGLSAQPPTEDVTAPATVPAPNAGPDAGLAGYGLPGWLTGLFSTPPGVEAAPSYLAPPEAAPAPRKTGTLNYNPQGVPTFKRFADVKRAETAGLLQGATSIEVGGKIYDWVQ